MERTLWNSFNMPLDPSLPLSLLSMRECEIEGERERQTTTTKFSAIMIVIAAAASATAKRQRRNRQSTCAWGGGAANSPNLPFMQCTMRKQSFDDCLYTIFISSAYSFFGRLRRMSVLAPFKSTHTAPAAAEIRLLVRVYSSPPSPPLLCVSSPPPSPSLCVRVTIIKK